MYERWALGRAVCSVIESSPLHLSVRIGLFGKWGEGKTSVFNLVEERERQRGNLIVRFSPWGDSSLEQMWANFAETLRTQLTEQGVQFRTGWFRVRHHAPNAISAIGQGHPVAKAIASLAEPLVKRYLNISKKDIGAIVSQLEAKRVIVFIDHLDRTDPKIIPVLLLALREVLDLPQFAFVLAFDREVIASALSAYNQAWAPAGTAFLEKIVDFPFDLPRPTERQVRRLAVREAAQHCEFVPEQEFLDVLNLLPSNPRKLKLFVRAISSMRNEIARHDQDELDWPCILYYQLLRVEDPVFAQSLVRQLTLHSGDYQDESANGLNWVRWAIKGEDEKQDEDKKFSAWLQRDFQSLPEEVRTRLTLIVRAWRSRAAFYEKDKFTYAMSLSEQPHVITWREYREFLRTYAQKPSAETIQVFLRSQSDARDCSIEQVATRFCETILASYSEILKRAAQTPDSQLHADVASEGIRALDLLSTLVFSSIDGMSDGELRTPDSFKNFLGICRTWAHFRTNDSDKALRAAERELLVRLISDRWHVEEFFATLAPWEPPSGFAETASIELTSQLTDICVPAVCEMALSLMKQPRGAEQLFDPDLRPALAYTLTHADSPLFRPPYRQEFVEVLAKGKEEIWRHDNVSKYLQLLLTGVEQGTRYVRRADARKIIDQHDLVEVIWRTIVARPPQYRFIQSVREMRAKLIELDVPALVLEEPAWLKKANDQPQLRS